MSRLVFRWALVCVTVSFAWLAPRAAVAQNPTHLPADFAYQKLHEWQLQHREARLQQDIAQGNVDRLGRDQRKIQWMEWSLWYDRRRIRQDMWLPVGPWIHSPGGKPRAGLTLIPHPQYPGFAYDPTRPRTLYPLGPSLNPALPMGPGGAAASAAAGPVSAAGAVPAQVAIVIVNSAAPGTVVDHVVDGTTYRIAGGQQQALSASPASTIAYNVGGTIGEQRYALSAGVYEFRTGGAGWALFKRPSTGPSDSRTAQTVAVPKNDLPKLTDGRAVQ